MAGVKGPLFSLDASGTIGNAVVYAKWKGRNYVRRHAIPANPKSASQVSVRAMMRFLSQYWDSLSDAQQTDWETRAAATNISPFNAFCSYNLIRWGQNLRPSKLDPAALGAVAGVVSSMAVTAGVRSLTVGATVATLNDNWGIAFFKGIAPGIGVTRNELVRVLVAESAAAFTFLDTNVTVGTTYYYRAYSFSDEGDVGNALDEQSAVPTA